MGDSVDFNTTSQSVSRPQEGITQSVQASIDTLNSHELNKMNMILEEHYNKKQQTILDKPLGEIINNTFNFFSHSYDSYNDKVIEAEALYRFQDNESYKSMFQIHLTSMMLFIRDNENIIYLGIIMIILSVIICFFNISRNYGMDETVAKS